jgi:hypothetical protein
VLGGPVNLEEVKAALGSTNFMLTAVQQPPPQPPQQQTMVLPQTISSGFAPSPFIAASTLPPLDSPEPLPSATVTSGAR